MAWWLWALMGIFLLVVEISTPGGLFALFFGIGAFVIAPLAILGVSPTVQWVLFTIVSLALLLTLRGFLRRRLSKRRGPAVENLVGEEAILLEDLSVGGEARAELRGTPWNARSAAAVPLAKGQRCVVERLDGLTLWLRAN
jgi:membrane protein implicated in regulation of membrane protease activity